MLLSSPNPFLLLLQLVANTPAAVSPPTLPSLSSRDVAGGGTRWPGRAPAAGQAGQWRPAVSAPLLGAAMEQVGRSCLVHGGGNHGEGARVAEQQPFAAASSRPRQRWLSFPLSIFRPAPSPLTARCCPGHTDSYVKDKTVPVTIALNHFRDGIIKKGQDCSFLMLVAA